LTGFSRRSGAGGFQVVLESWAVGGTCARAPAPGGFPSGVPAGQSACPLGARGRSVSGMPPGLVATGRHFGSGYRRGCFTLRAGGQRVQYLTECVGQGRQVPVVHPTGVQLGDESGQCLGLTGPRGDTSSCLIAGEGLSTSNPVDDLHRGAPRGGTGKFPPGGGMMTSTTSGSDPAPGAGPATRTNHTPGSLPGVGATGTGGRRWPREPRLSSRFAGLHARTITRLFRANDFRPCRLA
jgi:hypothetical protein